MSLTHLCQVCAQKTTYWCSRCHTAWYCSVEHMEYDWEHHRVYCRPFDEPAQQSQSGYSNPQQYDYRNQPYNPNPGVLPGPQQQALPTANFEALLFPCDEERARIVRVQCLAQPQTSGPTIWTPLPQEWLGTDDVSSHIITSGIGGAPLRFPLQVFYGARSFEPSVPVNRAIERLTGGRSTYRWAGNIVALKFSGSRRQGYTDATYNDVAPLIASFLVPAEPTPASSTETAPAQRD